MNQAEILSLFRDMKILQKGHFLLTSGLHSAEYMQCAALFEYPKQAARVVVDLVSKLPTDIDTIIAPAIGGITAGYEIARSLGCRFIFTERQNGLMTLRRGFTLQSQDRVLVVEDVVTTGGSVQEVLDIVNKHNCDVKGVAAIVDRCQGKVKFNVPFISLVSIDIKTYQPHECPLCLAGKSLTQPGSRSIS